MNNPMIITIVIMLLMFWAMSQFAKKQQKKMAAQQEARVNEALVPGKWVRTHSGYYGKVVEVDGEVVTLATALGDESLWNKRAIAGAEEPPFASHEDELADAADDTETETATQATSATEATSAVVESVNPPAADVKEAGADK